MLARAAELGVEVAPKFGWTDVAQFTQLGIPAVNYGPGDPTLAHSRDERLERRSIEDAHAALHRLADLRRHDDDFAKRVGFTYSVLQVPGDDVIGCVYIYPANDGAYDARIRSWVRASRAELDGRLRSIVSDWIASDAWPFTNVLYAPPALNGSTA